jgi:hypothetical protein
LLNADDAHAAESFGRLLGPPVVFVTPTAQMGQEERRQAFDPAQRSNQRPIYCYMR